MKSSIKKVFIIFIPLILFFIACAIDPDPPSTSPTPAVDISPSPSPTQVPILNLVDEMDASIVIGQVNFERYEANQGYDNPYANTLNLNYSRANIIESKLYIPDGHNHRILIFSEIPPNHNGSADGVLGQMSFTENIGGTTKKNYYLPQAISSNVTKLCICDYGNNRVIIYNYIPQDGNDEADLVVGQENFTSWSSGLAANRLNSPEDAILVGDKLVIADSGNNRVLIYNTIPIENDASADIVLGQNSFETNIANDDDQDENPDANPSARTLNSPRGLWSDGNILIVSDYSNNRVLIWDPFPTSNFEEAKIVLGQPDFESNNPGSSINQLNRPYYIDVYYQNQLFVVDYSNHRVLVWNSIPTSNGESADNYLGAGLGGPPAATLHYPTGVCAYGDQVFVSDSRNRVLIFNSN